jgi:hypothetical protein
MLLLAGCGGDIDKDKAQSSIKSGIASQGKADVKYVKCPGGVKAEKGATFQCEALIPVNVTQIDDNGNIRWQITSFIGPPSGATGATGATGIAGVTGATGASGATGAAADNQFETYTNRAEGYSISHPSLWKPLGSGADVNFPYPDGSRFIHVIIQDGKGLPKVSEMKASLGAQPNVQKVKVLKRDTVAGQPVIYAEYLFKLGKFQRQVIRRYVFAHGAKRALIEEGAYQKLANKKPLVKKFDRAVNSFRWTGGT